MTTPGTTVQITGHVYAQQYSWESTPTLHVWPYPGLGDNERTYVGPVEVAYTIPADYNPTAEKLAALAAKREQVCQEFAASVRAIDEQISKLQAITFDGVEA